MEEVSIGALGAIIPEIILLLGGILVLLLDTAAAGDEEQNSGGSYMAVSIIFLLVATVGALLQLLPFVNPTAALLDDGAGEVREALSMITIDPFSLFFKVTIYAGMSLVAIAGGAYMNKRATGRGEFWTLFVFVTLAMGMAVSANNLLLLFLSIEFLSITSYILAGFLRENDFSAEAGVKYFLYGSVASAVMLYGMSLLYGVGGSIYLADIAAVFAAGEDLSAIAYPAILLTLVGFGFKTSLAPFYQWAPDTYDGAPTPVTAYLSTASKAVGFAVLIRVFVIAFGSFRAEWVPILAGLSILTMTLGNLLAFQQDNVKRMLAYSSVAQAGYILMGLVAFVTTDLFSDVNLLPMNGINGVMIYLFAYLFTNVGAFMVVMAVEEHTGSTQIEEYRGLYRRSPALALAMLVFLLSLTGIPLTGGFVGKFYVFGAAVQRQYFWLVGFGAINVAIGAGYYLRIASAMFEGLMDSSETRDETGNLTVVDDSGDSDSRDERMPVSIPVQLALTVCVLLTLWIGIYPPNIIEWANVASRQLISLSF